MALTKCRVCNNILFEPLLSYENMPKSAQVSSVKDSSSINFNVCQCTKCELVQLDCDPIETYREVIRTHSVSSLILRQKQFLKFCNDYSLLKKKVLEVGCGRGEILEIINSLGMDAYGIEWNEDGLQKCIDKNFNVSKTYLDNGFSIIKVLSLR